MARPVSIPESSGFFVSGWSPGETLGQWNESAPGFLAQNNRSLHETTHQKKDRVSPGDQPLTKKPEDSGIKIVARRACKDRIAGMGADLKACGLDAVQFNLP